MPCRCDGFHPDPTPTLSDALKKELQGLTRHLDEVKVEYKIRVDQLTRLLCEVMELLPADAKDKTSEELKYWWLLHQADDLKRNSDTKSKKKASKKKK